MSVPVVSEAVLAKCARLLTSGAVTVECSEDGLVATVQGDHGVYVLVREADGRFSCPCPARVADCSHRLAVERVAT